MAKRGKQPYSKWWYVYQSKEVCEKKQHKIIEVPFIGRQSSLNCLLSDDHVLSISLNVEYNWSKIATLFKAGIIPFKVTK